MKHKSIILYVSLYTSLIIADSEQPPTHNHLHAIADEYCYLAQHMEQANQKDKALLFYKKALEIHPENNLANIKLGSVHYEQNNNDQAIASYKQALKNNPNDPHINYNLGLTYMRKEEWTNAIEHFAKTIELNPCHEQAYTHLGAMYEKINKHHDAVEPYKKAVELNPNSFDNQHQLGNILRHVELLDQAIEPYRKALEYQPRNIHIMMDLANILNMLNRNEESLELYKNIVEINPNAVSALYNFGFTLKKVGQLERALEVYQQVLSKKPDYAPAHFSLSSIYLTLGNLEEGWKEYEWRWKNYNEDAKKFNCPLWEGKDLTNKTLLVYTEQGLGDTLQFVRYLKLLKDRFTNLTIVLHAQTPLIPLLKHQPYIDQLFTGSGQAAKVNYQIPLMSLPRICKTTLESIPADIPYIQADESLVQSWKEKLASDTNLKVGICWQGNARYRTQSLRRAVAAKSLQLPLFEPLFNIEGISIYSLQRVDGDDQVRGCSFANKLIVFDESFDQQNGRFMDTAAVIENLDLIVSVDTSICHLAGALGKPTWIILPFPADWRWLRNRTDSPWYPTARLFQQKTAGQWEPVIQQIVQELQTALDGKNSFTQPQTIKKQSPIYNEPDEKQIHFFEQLSRGLT